MLQTGNNQRCLSFQKVRDSLSSDREVHLLLRRDSHLQSGQRHLSPNNTYHQRRFMNLKFSKQKKQEDNFWSSRTLGSMRSASDSLLLGIHQGLQFHIETLDSLLSILGHSRTFARQSPIHSQRCLNIQQRNKWTRKHNKNQWNIRFDRAMCVSQALERCWITIQCTTTSNNIRSSGSPAVAHEVLWIIPWRKELFRGGEETKEGTGKVKREVEDIREER